MIKAKYILTRANSARGFLSTNRVSTDALRALNAWSSQKESWNYEIEADEEGSLVAILTLDDNNADLAGVKLQDACQDYGVDRTHIPV